MKTIIEFETAEELLHAANKTRAEGDNSLFIPDSVHLIFENGTFRFGGEDSDRFRIGPKVTLKSVLEIALERCDLKVRIL